MQAPVDFSWLKLPTWLVAIAITFVSGIRAALWLKVSKNGNSGDNGAAERRTNLAVKEIVEHIDGIRDALTANQTSILQDAKETRHNILAPMKTVVDALYRELVEEK